MTDSINLDVPLMMRCRGQPKSSLRKVSCMPDLMGAAFALQGCDIPSKAACMGLSRMLLTLCVQHCSEMWPCIHKS